MKKLKMIKNKAPGKLITFCGLDGCGKTTLINDLIEDIGNKDIIFLTKQPTKAVRRSEIFRTYMDSSDHSEFDYRSLSLLAASDRIQHTNKLIKKKLEEGYIVISDRYFYSCLANLRARGYKSDKWIYEIAKYIIKPDLAFFLDVSPQTAISRVRQRPDEADSFIDIPLQYRLRQEYVDICRKNKGILINSSLSEEKCRKIVKENAERIIKYDHY